MGALAIGRQLRELHWPHLITGLVAVAILLIVPGESFTHHHHHNQNQTTRPNQMTGTSMLANNPIGSFMVFESIVGASITNTMLNMGQIDLLLFEFAVDMFLAGQIPDNELIQLMQFQAMMNHNLGI